MSEPSTEVAVIDEAAVLDAQDGTGERPTGRPGPLAWRLARGLVGPVILVGILVVLSAVLGTTTLFTVEQALAMAVFALATNLLVGYGGLVSFGQGAFFGAGSYTVALAWLHWHLSFWVALVLSPVVGAVLALLVGLVALRSRRLYFALLTLAFSQLFYVLAEERYSFTQGANGIVGPMIPESLLNPRNAYLFVLAASVVCALLLWKVTASPFGLVLRAIRENRERAQALGVNVFAHQLVAFVIAGTFCSVAGCLYVVYSQSAYPELLDWTQSGYGVFMVVIGGMFLFLGPALGAFVYVIGKQFLVDHTQDWPLVLGALLVLIVLFRPDGLAGLMSLGSRLGTRRGSEKADGSGR